MGKKLVPILLAVCLLGGAALYYQWIKSADNVQVNDDLHMRLLIHMIKTETIYNADTNDVMETITEYSSYETEISDANFEYSTEERRLYHTESIDASYQGHLEYKNPGELTGKGGLQSGALHCELIKADGTAVPVSISKNVWNVNEEGLKYLAIDCGNGRVVYWFENGDAEIFFTR